MPRMAAPQVGGAHPGKLQRCSARGRPPLGLWVAALDVLPGSWLSGKTALGSVRQSARVGAGQMPALPVTRREQRNKSLNQIV